MTREPKLYLLDILEAIAKVASYTKGISRSEFEADGMLQEAVLWRVGVIGTASRCVQRAMNGTDPGAPWRWACGLRDHLARDRFGLDDDSLWEAITVGLPALALGVDRLLTSFNSIADWELLRRPER